MKEKIFGYFLIFTGIVIIFSTVINIYRVFTKQSEPIQIFNFSGISINPSQLQPDSMADLPDEISKNLPDQIKMPQETQIIQPELLNNTSNLVAHLVLMGFILNAGYKLASIGTMMARPIVVKLKSQEQSQEKPRSIS